MALSFFLRGVAVSLPIGLTFVDCVGYIARVEGLSMQPTLNPHNYLEDYVFVSRWAVRNLEVERGEIVCLVSPKNPNDRLLKRIVGLQGDVVATIGYKKSFIKIPEGHCWIEGDNTGFSMDSNSFGPVSLGLVQSRAMCVVWPPSRWQFLQTKIKRSVEDD